MCFGLSRRSFKRLKGKLCIQECFDTIIRERTFLVVFTHPVVLPLVVGETHEFLLSLYDAGVIHDSFILNTGLQFTEILIPPVIKNKN